MARTICKCTGSAIEGGGFFGQDTNNSSFFADCVETEWLKKNGLSHGILRERGMSRVLCIQGLPCATEGHLLRLCDKHESCELVTYSQICAEGRADCIVTSREVSRLSHAVDWSSVRAQLEFGKSLKLTSLSEYVNGPRYYVSHGIAIIADKMNSYGYGRLCDNILLVVLFFEKSLACSLQYALLFIRQLTK